jgi:hypothetical protein
MVLLKVVVLSFFNNPVISTFNALFAGTYIRVNFVVSVFSLPRSWPISPALLTLTGLQMKADLMIINGSDLLMHTAGQRVPLSGKKLWSRARL